MAPGKAASPQPVTSRLSPRECLCPADPALQKLLSQSQRGVALTDQLFPMWCGERNRGQLGGGLAKWGWGCSSGGCKGLSCCWLKSCTHPRAKGGPSHNNQYLPTSRLLSTPALPLPGKGPPPARTCSDLRQWRGGENVAWPGSSEGQRQPGAQASASGRTLGLVQ